jgi:hypothetical protein
MRNIQKYAELFLCANSDNCGIMQRAELPEILLLTRKIGSAIFPTRAEIQALC